MKLYNAITVGMKQYVSLDKTNDFWQNIHK